MTEKAKLLLKKMVNAYDNFNQNSFDPMFYSGYTEDILNELYDHEYIKIKDNSAGIIGLTYAGYAKAKE